MNKAKLIPSMFHRRLALLVCGAAAVFAALGAQMARLTIVEGDQRRAEAESRLDQRRFLATYRGSIIDRRGRVLAQDRASNDVAVPYDVISGAWAYEQAARQARVEIGGTRWAELGPDDRTAAIHQRLPAQQDRVERLWRAIMLHGGLTRAELHERLDRVKRHVQTMAAKVWDRRAAQERARYEDMTEDEARTKTRRSIREQEQAHVILPRVDESVAFEFQRLAQEEPDLVDVQMSTRREYPLLRQQVTLDRSRLPRALREQDARRAEVTLELDGVADHVLGTMRDELWVDDVRRRPFVDPVTRAIDLGGYRENDSVGSRGLELTFEDRLRGTRGMVVKRLDTGEESRVEWSPGQDLAITLDIDLQARVQAILMPELGLTRVQQWHVGWRGGEPVPSALPLGTRLNSAAVVMDVQTSHVLALVSMPTIAMGQAAPGQRDPSEYLVNRAVEAIYPPGSIIKPLVLSAAVMERVHSLEGTIECTGHYFPDRKEIARCWIYRDAYGFQRHGGLQAAEALAQSCNIFFYTLADRLGMKRLSQWYERFGLGRPLDIGLLASVTGASGATTWIGEAAGTVPDERAMDELRKRGELAFASIIMGTGQGPVAWTPIQAANAYAMLARGGDVRDATLITDASRTRAVPARASTSLGAKLVDTTIEGLRQSVEVRSGTGHHITWTDGSIEPIINAPGVTTWAKTGTAQASPMQLDHDADGRVDARISGLSHAWFVGLVGEKGDHRPRYVIAVVVEYGGSGGKVAGPIANQIILALQDLGYLSKPAGSKGAESAMRSDDDDGGAQG